MDLGAEFKIAGLQMVVSRDVELNTNKILEGIVRASGDQVDFLVTPEGSLSGYTSEFDSAQVIDAKARLAAAAKEARVGLALGTCYKEIEGSIEYCYNQVRIYDPCGEYLGAHAKILRCSSLDRPGTGEMREYVEGTLRTFEWRGIRFGALICNDFWAMPGVTTMPNPYLQWRLKQMGARLILHSVNTGATSQRYRRFLESSVELWARALRLHVVQVNAAVSGGQEINTPSGVVGPEGRRLVEVPTVGEHYFTCVLDLPPGTGNARKG